MKEGSYNFVLRGDGRLEWICIHGVGHTVRVPLEHTNDSAWWSHGCDGCCNSAEYEAAKIDAQEIPQERIDEALEHTITIYDKLLSIVGRKDI